MSDLDALRAWITRAGGAHDAIDVAPAGDGLGVIAARALRAGEVALRVPRACFLRPAHGACTRVGRVIHAGWPGPGTPHLLLSALVARGGEAPWRTLLPDALPGFPLLWSAADQAALDGTTAGIWVAARRDHLATELAWLEAHDLPGERWAWARALVGSRVFGLRDGPALVPLADLLDHADDPEVAWEEDDDGLTFTLTRDVPAGTPLRHRYGAKSNARLLVHYGFTIPGNPHRDALVDLDGLLFLDPAEPDLRALIATADGRARLVDACQARLAGLPEVPADHPRAADLAAVVADERAVLDAWIAAGGAPPTSLHRPDAASEPR